MKYLFFLIVIILVLILKGCIPSLHGIAVEGEEKLDDRIVGAWLLTEDEGSDEDSIDKMIWIFERAASITFSNADGSHTNTVAMGAESFIPTMKITEKKNLPAYILTHHEISGSDTITNVLVVRLTQISDLILMDMVPYPVEEEPFSGRFYSNYILAHTFAKLHVTDQGLSIASFDGDYIENLIRNKSIRLKHEIIHDEDIILTARTEELRAFISKYADDPQLFDNLENLKPL